MSVTATKSVRPRPTFRPLAIPATTALGLFLSAGNASANTYAVNDTSMADKDKDNHNCTLIEALTAIHTNSKYHECPPRDGTRDVIQLKAGIGDYTVSKTIEIHKPVDIISATTGTLVRLVQAKSFAGSELISLLNLFNDPTAVTVFFRDIDFVGGGGSVTGIAGEGNSANDLLNLFNCWVEKFTRGGVDLLDMSLISDGSAFDSNSGSGNNATFGGGVFVEGNSSSTNVRIYRSSITQNGAGGLGLELDTDSVSLVQNSTISDNKGAPGLALFPTSVDRSAILEIQGATIAFNKCPVDAVGGNCGISNPDSFHSQSTLNNRVHLTNTVVAANTFQGGNTEADFSGSIDALVDSLIEDSTNAYFTPVATIARSLTNYGVTNLDTRLSQTSDGPLQRNPQRHKPLHNSICIDFTDRSGATTKDQRRQNRGVDSPFVPGTNVYDVGAVELQPGE